MRDSEDPYTHEYVPDVLVGALERAETYANAQQPLSAPRHARYDTCLPHGFRFTTVYCDC